jgi:ABC-2 type transport system permease protein
MSARRVLVISRHQTRLLLGNPGALFIFLLIPLLTMVIMRSTQKAALLAAGYRHVNGAEQAVPGFTVMFAFFWLLFIGRTFFAEHGWGTWERMQAMASTPEVVMGKLLPGFAVIVAQMIVLFAVGDLALGLTSKGPLLSLLILAPVMASCVLSLCFAIVSFCPTLSATDAVSNLLMLVFAALGGALTLVTLLPQWAQSIAPAIPSYWAMKASTDVILKGKGVGAVVGPVGVLLAFSVAFTVLAFVRFRPTDRKSIA